MRTDDLDYPFDESLVAKTPAEPRDSARLLVYRRATGAVAHRHVAELSEELDARDTLVVNETTVAPARIKAVRSVSQAAGHVSGTSSSQASGGAHIEGLLLERRGPRTWLALLRNTKRVKPGEGLRLVGPHPSSLTGTLRFISREGEGAIVEVEGGASADEVLAALGWTPLPPYILKARSRAVGRQEAHPDGEEDDADRRRYQTVFAAPTDAPSVAAPTAGLHFTDELFGRLAVRGVERICVSLQVGAGTFKPVETPRLEDHPMHTERCVVSERSLADLRAARQTKRRIVAVGTTSVRTLESMPDPLPAQGPLVWDTNILIAPGHRFRHVDALLTNFHLPRSTLLALVAALIGLDELKRVYAIATAERYRFYSYGDAMLII